MTPPTEAPCRGERKPPDGPLMIAIESVGGAWIARAQGSSQAVSFGFAAPLDALAALFDTICQVSGTTSHDVLRGLADRVVCRPDFSKWEDEAPCG